MSKLAGSIKEAIELSGLKDGMTISFHHHFREGDLLLNRVMEIIDEMGIHDLTLNTTGIFDVHKDMLVKMIQKGVITNIETNYMSAGLGKQISRGILAKPVTFRSHGGRDAAVVTGEVKINVAFIGAPSADCMGNLSGKTGPAACGTLTFTNIDAKYANKVIAVTDNLVTYPVIDYSIPEQDVDYVVKVDRIGEPSGIVSGILKITKDPIALCIARYAARIIEHCGLLGEEFVFQTGGGSISLAAAQYLKEMMLEKKIQGSAIIGGITGYSVDLLEAGCFRCIMDTQCMDLRAIDSLQKDPRHMELSIYQYAAPGAKSNAAMSLDVVILGATQIDVNFNANVHTDSNGYIIGGAGGNTDVATESKIAIVVAPLIRARMPVVVDKVVTLTTPGQYVDAFVTQYGIAVNPKQQELKERLTSAGLPVVDIRDLEKIADRLCGIPKKLEVTDIPVAKVLYRTKEYLDTIYKTLS